MKRIQIIILTLILSISLSAQKSDILLTIDNKKISSDEFVHIYTKNNSSEISEKSVDEYLELFINFKLKVVEAENLKMDTNNVFINEFTGYKNQLSKPYLTENEKFEEMTKESYERGKTDAKLDLIFIKMDKNASPEDTLLAYNKALNTRKRIAKGEDWDKVAGEVSDDKSVSKSKGHLSFISVSKIPPYSIQNFIFAAQKNELSMPLKTKFGYYIIRLVDTRLNPGEITVSHIMISAPDNLSKTEDSLKKLKIDSIYKRLQAGDNFEKMTVLSDDKGTAKNGGKLRPFTTGKMVPEFEATAFALKNPGEISKPIRTSFGWHIIKLIEKKPYPKYEDKEKDIRKQIERDIEKKEIIQKYVTNKLKNRFNFKEHKSIKNFYTSVDSSIFKAKWDSKKAKNIKGLLFTINDVKFSSSDFSIFIENNQKKRIPIPIASYVDEKYKDFVYESLVNIEKEKLPDLYPEYGYLMKEYHDGMLLFDLTKNEVWDKAINDSVGLKNFYDENIDIYNKQTKIDISCFSYSKNRYLSKAEKLLSKSDGKYSDDEIINKISTNPKNFKKEISGNFVKGDNIISDKVLNLVKEGKIIENQRIVKLPKEKKIIYIRNISKASSKPFNEIKGIIIADYQDYLEQKWITKLKKKYKIKINKEILDVIKRKMKK